MKNGLKAFILFFHIFFEEITFFYTHLLHNSHDNIMLQYTTSLNFTYCITELAYSLHYWYI